MMEGIMIFETQSGDYPRIITANTGKISGNNWVLDQGIIHELDQSGWVKYEVKFRRLTVNAGNDLTGFFNKQESVEEMTRAQLKAKMRLYAKSGFPIATYAVEYYNKTAIPYASFILALIAIPFTSLLSRKGWVWGLILSFLVILSYFFAQVMFRNLGQSTVIIPIVAAWGPNIIFLLLAIGLLSRVKR
jgi:lipopolysaccharide export LptBFGC system permease protein LptF